LRPEKEQLTHWEFDLATHPRFDSEHEDREGELRRHRERYLDGYRQRLEELLTICRDHDIEVVLMTQAALFGDGVDPTTGRELGELSAGGTSSSLAWAVLDLYNDVTRSAGKLHGLLVIDLARELPKDSAYYYDWLHVTETGAAATAAIVSRVMIEHLRENPRVFSR
jgi:hypothetical protein